MVAHATHSHFIKYANVLLIFKNGNRKVIKFLKTEKGIMYDVNHNTYPLKKIRCATYYNQSLDTRKSI